MPSDSSEVALYFLGTSGTSSVKYVIYCFKKGFNLNPG
jgi:hypothetical protein